MLKNNNSRSIEEIIIIVSAVIVTISITPFAIYRYLNGQIITALIEIICITTMCCIGAYVWNTRKTKVMSVAASVFILGSSITFNYLLGTSMIFWMYPIIMTVYFINPLLISFCLVSSSIVTLIPALILDKTFIEVWSVLITLTICQLFSYLFSKITREQYSIMENLANYDGLTGASNRRALEERLHFICDLFTRQKKKQESVASLIILDIDNFKTINDQYGHIEGDNILKNLAKLFRNNIRAVDQLYRYGGEEFIIIANGADTLRATELAEKLRIKLENTQLSELTMVTASFGVAELEKHEQPKHWLGRADRAMYRAKRGGRNRVFIANFEGIPEVNTPANFEQKPQDITC